MSPRIHKIADILQTRCLAQSFLQSLGQKLLIIYANTPLLNVNKERENNNHRERERERGREDCSLHFTFKFYVLGPSFKRRGSLYIFRFVKYNLNHEMGIT